MESQRPHPTLTADILTEIFLRADSPADLARAAAACVGFCRLIADPSFLSRYRSLHKPLLLGFIGTDGLHPVPAPHPNATAALAFARTVNFSFRYLPRDVCVVDIRDGRILVELIDEAETSILLWDLAVCNPVSRSYQLVPRIPDDVLAAAQIKERDIVNFYTSLVPSGDFEAKSFRVIRCILVKTGLVLFVFSSVSGQWSVTTSTSWDALRLDAPKAWTELLDSRRYVHGCFYWKVNHKDKLLKLDMNTMKFSTHDLPPDQAERTVVIVEAEDGELAMFSHDQVDGGRSLDYYTFSPNGSKKGGEWKKKNTVMLPSQYECNMLRRCQSEGHIFLFGVPKAKFISHHACFALDIKTFKVERLNGIYAPAIETPYSGFPPIISPRKIQGPRLASRSVVSSVSCCFLGAVEVVKMQRQAYCIAVLLGV
ncbi:hypothetical protein EJB05_11928, partial [Eragrostis curvula]